MRIKKHRYENRKNRYVVGIAVILAGCMLWGGCGMGESRNADPEEAANTEKETVGVIFPVRDDSFAGGAVSGDEGTGNGRAAAGDEGTGNGRAAAGDEGTGNDKASTGDENTENGRASTGDEDTGNGRAATGDEDAGNDRTATEPDDINSEKVPPLLEQLFSYEINRNYGSPYLTVTGITEEYRDSFWENMEDITGHSDKQGCMLLPADVNGMPVKAIGEEAFADLDIKWLGLPDTLVTIEAGAFRNTGISRLELPENLEYIGAGAFEGCGLVRLQLPDKPLTIGERAFAGSRDLWTVLIPNGETLLEDGVFADCREGFLLCYGDHPADGENSVPEYARDQGLDCMEIILSREPIVNYPDQPLVLKPKTGSFFYGDYGYYGDYEDYDEELWCSWEEDEDAPNFGYIDWQAPGCSSWCGAYDFELEVKASSELASAEGRYAADNVVIQNRRGAWAEGAEGLGIGESLTYRQSCTYGTDNKWEALTYDNRDPELDGFMRYSEICIVNGYAKTRQTWEQNGRVKKLLLYVEDRPYAYLELADTMQPQYFELPEDDIKVINGGMLEVRFEILEVYPGSVYEDTCLTGLILEFTGRYAH